MGLKDNTAHETSCARHTVEIAKLLKEKMSSCMNVDGGGCRNPTFERAQAFVLCLVMKLKLDNLVWLNTDASGSALNPAERAIASSLHKRISLSC